MAIPMTIEQLRNVHHPNESFTVVNLLLVTQLEVRPAESSPA